MQSRRLFFFTYDSELNALALLAKGLLKKKWTYLNIFNLPRLVVIFKERWNCLYYAVFDSECTRQYSVHTSKFFCVSTKTACFSQKGTSRIILYYIILYYVYYTTLYYAILLYHIIYHNIYHILYYIILYYIILYYIILYYIILYYIILYYIILYYIILYYIILYYCY